MKIVNISSQTYTDFGIRKVDQVVDSVMRDVLLLSKVVIVQMTRNTVRQSGLRQTYPSASA